jgi:hypothetical protein
MSMAWPQITLLVLIGIGMVGSLFMHGKPRTDIKYDFRVWFVRTAVLVTLLYLGGFWTMARP